MLHTTHRRIPFFALAALLVSIPLATARATASAEGESLFRQHCGTCHTVKKDEALRAGPPLYGVIGRKAGSVSGFDYSDALRGAGFTWDPGHLERWLVNSNEFVPGSYMNYRQNDDTVRKGIIQYLSSLPAN